MVKMQQKHVHDIVSTWQLMNFFSEREREREKEREGVNGKWVKTDDQAV